MALIIGGTTLDHSCKWPEWRHFVDADIQPRIFYFCNRRYLGFAKQKRGSRVILYTATLRPFDRKVIICKKMFGRTPWLVVIHHVEFQMPTFDSINLFHTC